ncbi:hypothetical protein BLNAU_13629 [Blattamonas nauphoetae]|uniref:Uncharacterized protein n=1 Tax=Blattamonas nauphoetae TaxID=2049346 RepID=A0ABQ9XG76_9EUKA|nr:hypothetical protein BLNAU_13629 [Blattamonas nauphoetae]
MADGVKVPEGYSCVRIINSGGFGTVVEMIEKSSNMHYAGKMVQCLTQKDIERDFGAAESEDVSATHSAMTQLYVSPERMESNTGNPFFGYAQIQMVADPKDFSAIS